MEIVIGDGERALLLLDALAATSTGMA